MMEMLSIWLWSLVALGSQADAPLLKDVKDPKWNLYIRTCSSMHSPAYSVWVDGSNM